MKKVDRALSKNYPPVVVKIEDLEEIEALLREHAQKVTIRCDDYVYESTEELFEQQKGARISDVEVKSNDPYVILECDRISARVYVSSSDTSSAGLFYRLDTVLSRCVRRAPWAYTFKFVVIANLIMLAVAFVMPLGAYKGVVSILLSVLFLTWIAWASFINIWRHSTVIVARRREERSFLERNRDQLTIALVSATLGALLGGTATYVVNNILKPAQSNSTLERDAQKAERPSP